MNLVLDTGVLGKLCHPKAPKNRHVVSWLAGLLEQEDQEYQVFLPEIADYELRRKLLHLIKKGQASEVSLRRLDELGEALSYIPLSTESVRRAAEHWAEARATGLPTATPGSLDGDVLLAAQAESVGGVVVTENLKHLSRFVVVRDWREVGRDTPKTLPYEEGQLPPRGYMLAQDEVGNLFWIDPHAIAMKGQVRSELSEEQVKRIRTFRDVFADVYPRDFEAVLSDFRKDAHPEQEICIWEFLASVYQHELDVRGVTDRRSRHLLFKVLMGASQVRTFDELLATVPEAKSVPDCRRVFDLVNAARQSDS